MAPEPRVRISLPGPASLSVFCNGHPRAWSRTRYHRTQPSLRSTCSFVCAAGSISQCLTVYLSLVSLMLEKIRDYLVMMGYFLQTC